MVCGHGIFGGEERSFHSCILPLGDDRRVVTTPAIPHDVTVDISRVAQLFEMKLATDLFSIQSDVLTKIQKDDRSCGAGKV